MKKGMRRGPRAPRDGSGGTDAPHHGRGRSLPIVGGREWPAETGAARDLGRRDFMKLLGAGIAAASAQGCVEPPAGRIVPYVEQPPEITPGVPVPYATAFVLDGFATGIVVRTREGRPIKVDGNPLHPASLGGSGVLEQAHLYHLYDPDRGRSVTAPPAGAGTFRAAADALAGAAAGNGGAGVRLLLEPTTSPLRAELLDLARERFPGLGVHFWSPAPDDATRAAGALFGRPLLPVYDFGEAAVVVSFGADFTAAGPFRHRYARRFADRRRIRGPGGRMNRLYQAESHPSPTGAVADHTLPARVGELPYLLAHLLEELGAGADVAGALPEAPASVRTARSEAWVRHAAADLREHRGACLVLAGEGTGAAVHALAHRANEVLGNVGRTVALVPSPVVEAGEASHGLEPLVRAMEAGEVRTLAVLGGNPAYAAPADLPFADLLEGVDTTLYTGLYPNETAALSDWYVPAAHPLESWGDARALDGTVTVLQPLLEPIYGGRSPDALLRHLAGLSGATERELLRARHDEETWDAALRRGLVEGSRTPATTAAAGSGPLRELLAEVEPPPRDGVEVAFRLDPRVHDGGFANNPWLQELPDPVTKLTWGNAAVMSFAEADRLGVVEGEIVEVAVGGRSVALPALPLEGHADRAVTLSLGYGRGGGEYAGAGVGVSCYGVRTTARPDRGPGSLRADPAAEPHPLARTQAVFDYRHERHQVLHATLDAYREDAGFTAEHRGAVESLYEPPDVRPATNQWGMTIDLAVCTGCGACTAACQVENNIPVVGKEEVLNHRQMHWIRIDRYLSGPPEHPEVLTQPMLCQHCEKAPCEYVCPVSATVHSADGLNEMVYNRCVGTRFCSNNCPYKVRRFNWFDYNERRAPEETLVLNPDVTVRERGVMEKCTYCVQRIRRAQIEARNEDRPLEDGEVVTACQQACPTRAIVFGDLADLTSAVAASREEPRIYDVLHELGTEPRTKYLAKIVNPNRELYAEEEAARAIAEHAAADREGTPGDESEDGG